EMDERIAQAAGPAPPAGGPPAGAADARDLYDMGIEHRNRGNLGTARRAFQQVVDSFPEDPLAPQALRQIAEALYLED
ncbi:MAG: hypothetical protein GWN71_09530, partial [Gammaproteobacteria bacterium]|nr:hypothetical protein [Gemmatimonadota bacterium]NIU73805.1 hypothetical protein [Gammaproteobacteria bacterium]